MAKRKPAFVYDPEKIYVASSNPQDVERAMEYVYADLVKRKVII